MSDQIEIVIPLSLPWIWSADVQRQTALALARRGHTVHVYRVYEGIFWLRKLRNILRYEAPPEDRPNLIFHRPIYLFPPTENRLITKINDGFALWLFSTWMNLTIKKPRLLYLCALEYADYPARFRGWKSLYMCGDYHTYDKPLFDRAAKEAEIFRAVDYPFTNSFILRKVNNHIRADIQVVSHGICIDDFRRPLQVETIKRKGRLLIGYVGGISTRMAWNILEPLISGHPEWDFAFFYPDSHLPSKVNVKKFDALTKYKNVRHQCTNNRRELAGYMKQFDVGIIPYNTSPFNYYCFPMKLYEYFLYGLPVLSSSMVELERFPGLVMMSDSADQWEKWLKQIEKKGWPEEKKKQQLAVALPHSWDNTVSKVLRQIPI